MTPKGQRLAVTAPEPVAEDLVPPIPVRVVGRQQVKGENTDRVLSLVDVSSHHALLVARRPNLS